MKVAEDRTEAIRNIPYSSGLHVASPRAVARLCPSMASGDSVVHGLMR